MPDLSAEDLDELLSKIAARAVREALAELGLKPDTAADDMRELRGLLEAWRDTKKTIRQSVVGTLSKAFVGLILVAMAFYAKDWLQK